MNASTERTKKRTLVRWLRVKLELCARGTRPFAGLTPAAAWKKAKPHQRYYVMRDCGFFNKFSHAMHCPACNPGKHTTIPPQVLKAFRDWQRNGS